MYTYKSVLAFIEWMDSNLYYLPRLTYLDGGGGGWVAVTVNSIREDFQNSNATRLKYHAIPYHNFYLCTISSTAITCGVVLQLKKYDSNTKVTLINNIPQEGIDT